MSSVFTAPDAEEEIRTLAHFRLYKPNPIAVNQRDGELLDGETYTYESIDWEAMGCELLPSHPLKWNPSEGDIVNPIPEESGYDDTLATLYEEEGRD